MVKKSKLNTKARFFLVEKDSLIPNAGSLS
jgi:hypothetical protein